MAFAPEFDLAGVFCLTVEYQPWARTERGKRRPDVPLRFDIDAEDVHRFETASYPALVRELEAWLARCAAWQREGNQLATGTV